MRKAEAFYKTKAWRQCRDGYAALRSSIDGGLCEICHEVPAVIVHHKTHLTAQNVNDPEISLNYDNLQYVCHHCHDVIHGYGGSQKNESRVIFDPFGNVLPR